MAFPAQVTIQLSAFASELSLFDSEAAYNTSQESGDGAKFASQSFIPSGLFVTDEATPKANAIFTGFIKEFTRFRNAYTDKEFYWFLVDTFGGDIDVLADPKLVESEPQLGGILSGSIIE